MSEANETPITIDLTFVAPQGQVREDTPFEKNIHRLAWLRMHGTEDERANAGSEFASLGVTVEDRPQGLSLTFGQLGEWKV